MEGRTDRLNPIACVCPSGRAASAAQLYSTDDLENDIQDKVEEFERLANVPCLHTVAFY